MARSVATAVGGAKGRRRARTALTGICARSFTTPGVTIAFRGSSVKVAARPAAPEMASPARGRTTRAERG